MGRHVARHMGANLVHFMWMTWWRIPNSIDDNDRSIAYNAYSVSDETLLWGSDGVDLCQFCQFPVLSRPGFVEIVSDAGNAVHATMHQREDIASPYNPWHMQFPIVGNVLHVSNGLGGWDVSSCDEVFWPRISHTETGSANFDHIIAMENSNYCTRNLVYYWRYNISADLWEGPVVIDSTSGPATYVIETDPNSQRCAIVLQTANEPQFNGLNNVAYYESQTVGSGWLNGSELGNVNKRLISNYSEPDGSQAWEHIAAAYDHDGVLHVVFDEANDLPNMRIRHWNSHRGSITTVAIADWLDAGMNWPNTDMPLSKVTVGIGDGSTTCGGVTNEDFLYVVYTRLAGPTEEEQEDVSASGYFNGELYLNVSSNSGNSWSVPVNLTNTKTPGCNPGLADPNSGLPQNPDSVCRSEHWASINKTISDIDVVFISDLDAGAVPLGEGTWQLNPVHYLRLPGGTDNASYLCPNTTAMLTSTYYPPPDDACGIHASGSDTVFNSALNIVVFGGTPVSGRVRVVYTNPPAPESDWLQVGGLQIVPFSLHPLSMSQPWIEGVTMVAAGLARGTYNAEIRVEQSDSTLPPFDIHMVAFNVDPCGCIADPACDGATNVQDIVAVIDAAFRGAPESPDAFCTAVPLNASGVTDVNCSGTTDVVDVVSAVGVAFRGLNATSTFCSPCANQPETTNSLRTAHRAGDRSPVY